MKGTEMNFLRKLRAFLRKEKLDGEMSDEMRAHLELQAAENERRGMNAEEARYAAQRAFGGVEQIKERVRDARGWTWLEQTRQDLSHAWRALRRQPGFTAVAVGTLALGLGVNAALFSVFNAVALRALPVKDPEHLVDVVGRNDTWGVIAGFSYLDFADLRASRPAATELAAWLESLATMDATEVHAPAFIDSRNVPANVARLPVQVVSDNFLPVMGAEIALGRNIRPDEATAATRVIVLQHQFWTQQFQANPAMLGQAIVLNDVPFTIIGVTAPEFVGRTAAPPIGWIPAAMLDALGSKGDRVLADRHSTRFRLVARLAPGVRRETVQAALEVGARRLAQEYPDDHRKTRIEFQESATFMALPLNVRTVIGLLPIWLGFALVLLVACANVANLLLARATMRQHEIGVRLALGASRTRILRHLLAESTLIALAGGTAGLLVATWFVQAIRPPLFAMLPPVGRGMRDWLFLNLTPDYRVFAFTLVLAFLAALAAGLFPALHAARSDVNAALKNDAQGFSRRSRLRHALVIIQVAICLTLLVATALLVRHVIRFADVDTGLRTQNVYTANLLYHPQDGARETGGNATAAGLNQALEAARSVPGVNAVARVYRPPFAGRMRLVPAAPEEGAESAPPPARFNLVSAEFFSAVGLPTTRGRVFTPREVATGAPVVVISETAAARFWPGTNPLGRRLRVAADVFDGGWADPRQGRGQAPAAFTAFEVIGVVRDTRSGWVWERDDVMLYLPLPPTSSLPQRTLVQLAGPRERVMPLGRGVTAVPGGQRSLVLQVALDDGRDLQLLPFKAVAALGALLGGMALLMAVIGLYGVMSFVVNQRVREIGIRVALGASGRAVVQLFVRQGMRLVAIGIVVGGVAGGLVGLALSKVVVGTHAFDPVALLAAALVLAVAALLACWVPARRATRVDPMVALRVD